MKFSPSLKRRLLASVEQCRAKRQLLVGFDTASNQVERMERTYPGRKVVVLPVKYEFLQDWDGSPMVRVIPERVQLARPRFVLDEKALATLTVQTVGLSGVRTTSWLLWSMSSGTWHIDHLELYFRSIGVKRTAAHRKITKMVSPSDGWVLTRPTVGAVFRDEYERVFAITKLGRTRTELIQIDGEYDCMYRAINLVKVKVTKPTSLPRGALQFLGILGKERLAEVILFAGTGRTYGTGEYHAA